MVTALHGGSHLVPSLRPSRYITEILWGAEFNQEKPRTRKDSIGFATTERYTKDGDERRIVAEVLEVSASPRILYSAG